MGTERYRPIVPGWEAFARTAGRRERAVLRVNTRRISLDSLRSRLEGVGFRLEPVEGLAGFLRVEEEPFPVSMTLEHWLGHFYLQQAVTGVAPLALGARPGERILDLCAAPGGKASHLAERLEDSGVVVAGESNEGRIRALLGNLYRLGHAGVLVVSADGRAFPGGAPFDRVLVDVPCSGEGNLRRRGGSLPSGVRSASFRRRIARVQGALLERAVEVVRPGGTVLYVTCTFAPEENEAVVAGALERLPVAVEPIELDLPHAPGITSFGGRAFPPELEQAWRLYPQHLDSGGLFMVRLRRHDDSVAAAGDRTLPDDGWSEVPWIYPDGSGDADDARRRVEQGLDRLHEETGVSLAALRATRWMARGESVWMHTCAEWPVGAWERAGPSHPAGWRVIATGLRAFRQDSGGRLRATNDLLRRLDTELRDRVIELSRPGCLKLLETGDLPVDGVRDGYVAIRLEGRVLGRGWIRSGTLRPEIPKAHASGLVEALRVAAAAPTT